MEESSAVQFTRISSELLLADIIGLLPTKAFYEGIPQASQKQADLTKPLRLKLFCLSERRR